MSDNVVFSVKQLAFIDWLAVGKYTRTPPTQVLFADQSGVNPKTLERWKKGNGTYTEQDFKEAVIARAREFLAEGLPDVYGSLLDEATKGSYQHQKIVLELTGEYQPPKQRVDNVNIDTSQLSDEQLERIANGEDPITVATSGESGA